MAATDTNRAGDIGVGLYQPPAMRAAKISSDSQASLDAPKNESGSRGSKNKRPDMQVYVPRARRHKADTLAECPPQPTPATPKSSKMRNSSPSVVTPRKKSAGKTKKPSSKALSVDSDASGCDLLDDADEDKLRGDESVEKGVQCAAGDESIEEPCAGPKLEVSGVQGESSSLSVLQFVPQDLGIEEDSWDAMFDDSGECLDPNLMIELTKTLGKVKVEQPSGDYSSYEEARETLLADSDYAHVLEVHGFPAEFKTQDLAAVLNPYAGRSGFDLKWVDDTHALAIFSNSQIAAEVLSVYHPLLKVRPLSQATTESKNKAKKCPQTLRPYRPRPETCSAMAKRMVSSALGVKLVTSKEEREKEKNMLREAREKKRLAVKQSQDAWEGKIGSLK